MFRLLELSLTHRKPHINALVVEAMKDLGWEKVACLRFGARSDNKVAAGYRKGDGGQEVPVLYNTDKKKHYVGSPETALERTMREAQEAKA